MPKDNDQQQDPQTEEYLEEMQEESTEEIETQEELANCPKCAEYKAGWQRAQADYQNLQKQTAEQRSEWAKFSTQQVLEDFIPVYDNFKKAYAVDQSTWGKEATNWAKGIEYIMKQFWKVLEDHGITEIQTVGEAFNPELHEAVGEEASDKYDEHIIIRETDGGYMMGEKVVKVAKVIICKK